MILATQTTGRVPPSRCSFRLICAIFPTDRPLFSAFCRPFCALWRSFSHDMSCFQYFTDSFAQNRGWGIPRGGYRVRTSCSPGPPQLSMSSLFNGFVATPSIC